MSLGAATALSVAGALAASAPANAWPWRYVPKPNPNSLEYRRSWALHAIGADAAYAAGYTGRGVRVALVDCGIQRRKADLGRNLSRESTDVVPMRLAHLRDSHGDWVAEPLGSRLDSGGIIGVAYRATLLEIRADMDGGYKGECAFWPSDVARALDYAAAHDARIVVLPMQAKHALGADFEAALTRVVQSGAVVVVSAGNDALESPSWPALYAADPRFASSMVVAGAAGYDGDMTKWSNRAGVARARYVLAPGEWILTDCAARCDFAFGTSFAAPFVAGAIALMMEAHPELSGPDAAERILAAARPLGGPGSEAVYGRGMLDLARAFGRKDPPPQGEVAEGRRGFQPQTSERKPPHPLRGSSP
jgi:subtilisin family serine protease